MQTTGQSTRADGCSSPRITGCHKRAPLRADRQNWRLIRNLPDGQLPTRRRLTYGVSIVAQAPERRRVPGCAEPAPAARVYGGQPGEDELENRLGGWLDRGRRHLTRPAARSAGRTRDSGPPPLDVFNELCPRRWCRALRDRGPAAGTVAPVHGERVLAGPARL